MPLDDLLNKYAIKGGEELDTDEAADAEPEEIEAREPLPPGIHEAHITSLRFLDWRDGKTVPTKSLLMMFTPFQNGFRTIGKLYTVYRQDGGKTLFAKYARKNGDGEFYPVDLLVRDLKAVGVVSLDTGLTRRQIVEDWLSKAIGWPVRIQVVKNKETGYLDVKDLAPWLEGEPIAVPDEEPENGTPF